MSLFLSERGHIQRIDCGLTGVRGAQEVIAAITSRKTVSKLILGHNKLGDDGCAVLFQFLTSSVGRRYKIREISLNTNGIGNIGLPDIAAYLNGNHSLKELFLQNNAFSGDPAVISTFTNGLNNSKLEFLSLTTNRALSDSFIEAFLPALSASSLREMHLSAIDMTSISARHIAEYISSKRCQLHTLKCNGNNLGYRGVKSIIRAIEQQNYSLTTVELYSNQLGEEETPSDTGSGASPGHLDAWKDVESRLARVLTRNRHLKRETKKQSLELLRYSRILLLPASCSRFNVIPIELQHYILSFIAPTLSPAQRSCVFKYASSTSTLPQLLPSIWNLNAGDSHRCIPDPLSLSFGQLGSVGGCTGGRCLGKNSLVCHKEQERLNWLEAVGCTAYDP